MDFTDADDTVEKDGGGDTGTPDRPAEQAPLATARPRPGQGRGTLDFGETDLEKASEVNGVTYRAEFPWLYEPDKGVAWDFDPVETRTLAQRDTWVQMLVETIVKEIAETSWTIVSDADRTETQKRMSTAPGERAPIDKALGDATAERIHDLLRNPNPDSDWSEFIQKSMADLLEVGSASTVKAFNSTAYDADQNLRMEPETIRPRALSVSAPEVWTKDFHDKTDLIDKYWQFDRNASPGGSRSASRGISQAIGFDPSEVMWHDTGPRSNRRYGLPPTLFVLRFVKAVDLSIQQEQEYLSRGSTGSGMINVPDWTQQEWEDWKEENEENVKGKPWKMLSIYGTEAEYQAFSRNFKEMEHTERQRWYARVIASAFQVPTAMVGVEPEKVNYSTFQGERENFESNTLGPYLQELERWINNDLIEPHWGADYRFEFTPGLSESTRQMIGDRVRGLWNDNLITRAEARREIGRETEADDIEDGFKDDLVEGGDDAEDLLASLGDGGDSGNANGAVRKAEDEPLRNTDDWSDFSVQPDDIDDLAADLETPIDELFDAVLNDDRIADVIDRMAAPDESIDKSTADLARRLRDVLASLDVADRIAETIQTHTAESVTEAVGDALTDADADELDPDSVDVEAVRARLTDRDVAFADGFADRMSEEIRETVGDGFAEGKNSFEIREDIAELGDMSEGWNGAERIARQETQVAMGEARNEVARELGKVEVWHHSGDYPQRDGARESHADMDGAWKWPEDNWVVDYSPEGGPTAVKENVPGNSSHGVGCRCGTLLRDRDEVARADYAGDGSPETPAGA